MNDINYSAQTISLIESYPATKLDKAELPALELCNAPVAIETTELSLVETSFVEIESKNEAERAILLREENQKLQQMITHLQRYNGSLQALVEFEYKTPNKKRLLLAKLEQEFGISRRHACRILKLARSTFWYKSNTRDTVDSTAYRAV